MNRLVAAAGVALLRASLLVSPRPATLLIRRVFAKSGAELDAALAAYAPGGIERIADEAYGDHPDEILDVYRRADSTGPAPTIVWTHGGGFVGGSKEELGHWFEVLAADGYTVVAPRYSLAPAHRYPKPVEQVLAALGHVTANGQRLHVDPARLVLAGDSAGAQITAQVTALLTNAAYAEALAIVPTIPPERVRGVVLCCGAYDPSLVEEPGWFVRATLWAYSGRRDYERDPRFTLMRVPDHVTPDFPPAFLTAGNADPLLPHTTAFLERLRERGVETDALLFPPHAEPPLGHEYQFRLDTPAGQEALRRLLSFAGAVTGRARAA